MLAEVLDVPFTKMVGAGNDFVVVDNRNSIVTTGSSFARRVCDRRFGIGADGLLLLEKSDASAFKMEYFNADGSYGGMCGNGGRCISRYAFLNKIVASNIFSFEALGHQYRSTMIGDNVELQLKNPTDFRINQKLTDSAVVMYHFVNTGSPHCIVFVEDNRDLFLTSFDDEDIEKYGKLMRFHAAFSPHGTNVNFVKILAPSIIQIRTYERGVEAETLACGTGAVASALISNVVKTISFPITVKVRSGEDLSVRAHKFSEFGFDEVTLLGSARIAYNGTIRYNMATQTIVETN